MENTVMSKETFSWPSLISNRDVTIHPTSHWSLDLPLNKLILTRNDNEISASPRNIGIYMTLFEQNCNNLKMAAIGRNM